MTQNKKLNKDIEITSLDEIEYQMEHCFKQRIYSLAILFITVFFTVLCYYIGLNILGLMFAGLNILFTTFSIIDNSNYRYWSTKYYMFKYFKKEK